MIAPLPNICLGGGREYVLLLVKMAFKDNALTAFSPKIPGTSGGPPPGAPQLTLSMHAECFVPEIFAIFLHLCISGKAPHKGYLVMILGSHAKVLGSMFGSIRQNYCNTDVPLI